MSINPFGPRLRDPDMAARVKRWAHDAFALDDEVTIMVTELRCTEPDCPPLETVIAIMHSGAGKPLQYKLHKPLAEVARDDVSHLAAQSSSHVDH